MTPSAQAQLTPSHLGATTLDKIKTFRVKAYCRLVVEGAGVRHAVVRHAALRFPKCLSAPYSIDSVYPGWSCEAVEPRNPKGGLQH